MRNEACRDFCALVITPSGRRGSFELCGVRIDHCTRSEVADALVAAAAEHRRLAVHLCNAYVLSLASRDQAYRVLLDRSDLNVADGAPVVWFGRRLGCRFDGARPSGTEVVLETAKRGVGEDVGHYLYGAAPGVADAMAGTIARAVPEVRIAGAESPPFRSLTDYDLDSLAERVASAGAVVLWIGLGTPRQDRVVARLAPRVHCPVIPVGAAFDFLGGTKPRAPGWMRRAGLEWVHRLGSEPRRLWRRYLVGNTRFLLCATRSVWAGSPR